MTTKFHPGDKVEHGYFGRGKVLSVYAVAQHADEETEYVVKLRSERYPAHIGESRLVAVK